MLQAKFVLSAASASDFPRTGVPEIALVGRSNVGKSSLINALLKQKIARTSAAPGKTRLANYYLIAAAFGSFYLVDLPGYGYARGGRESAQTFDALANEYFDRADQSGRLVAGAFHLIDARHPNLPQDKAAHGWLLRAELPVAIIATKMDKLTRAEKMNALRVLEAQYDSQILPTSAVEGSGMDDVWNALRRWAS